MPEFNQIFRIGGEEKLLLAPINLEYVDGIAGAHVAKETLQRQQDIVGERGVREVDDL